MVITQSTSQETIPDRKIIHIDMDAFYASVEQRDQPQLQGRPVVVGGSPAKRGVVAACSYEARQFGIHSAMSSAVAYRLCPAAKFVRPRMEVYKTISQQIQQIFNRYTPQVEPLSLDEAYLDVSDVTEHKGYATQIARHIRQDIFEQTRLTASAGVSYNKFLAKLASAMNKPNGMMLIRPTEAAAVLQTLPVGKLHGIGRVTEQKMQANGIFTGGDLKRYSLDSLTHLFGKAGKVYYHMARGIDARPVKSRRLRKSIGSESTFQDDVINLQALKAVFDEKVEKLTQYLQHHQLLAKTITLKIKYSDFELITRSKTVTTGLQSQASLRAHWQDLVDKTEAGQRPVRLLGVSVSSLVDANASEYDLSQLDLFEPIDQPLFTTQRT